MLIQNELTNSAVVINVEQVVHVIAPTLSNLFNWCKIALRYKKIRYRARTSSKACGEKDFEIALN